MKRGSITLQLSLVLGLSLSLVLYSIRSVRIADGRVLMSSALEQGLYSLFAGYDRDLFEEYGLLFLDGGYGGKDLQPGRICREVTEAAEYIIDSAPFKQGRFAPASHVPIVPPEHFLEHPADVILIAAPGYTEEIFAAVRSRFGEKPLVLTMRSDHLEKL